MSKYTPHTQSDIKEMLEALGLKKVEDLYSSIPENIRYPQMENSLDGMTEGDAERKITAMADKNRIYNSIFLGAGAYKH